MRWLLATLALCGLLVADSASAVAPSPINKTRLDRTIRYLQEAQNPDGGFGGDAGGESGQGISAWVALALATGGVNPRCQAKPGGVDAYSFLVDHLEEGLEEEIAWPKVPTTAFERELMVANTAGTDPHSYADYDLVAEILARAKDDGSFPYVPGGRGEINDTIFAIVALAPIEEPEAQAAIQRAADWLIGQQDEDGGWSWEVKGGRTEADMTGAAIQALRAAGQPDTQAEHRGLRYLREMQNPDGGFPEFPGEAESNVASTAWAVQAIWAVGQDPETWIEGGNEPLSYMASLQQADGHIRWKASQDMNGIWMTAYVAPAFAGQVWPIPAQPMSTPGLSAATRTGPGGSCAEQAAGTPPRPGQGEGTQSGHGVIAGGGSSGAPLFSRPKPQSKGKTPGGARVVHREGNPLDHSKTRRGGNTEQPSGTATREASRERDRGGAVSGDAGNGSGASSHGNGRQGKKGSGRNVTGALVSAREGALAFGAPGLHSAGSDSGAPWTAIAIAALALLLGLAGSQLERRRGGAFA